MLSEKVNVTVQLTEDLLCLLDAAAERYQLPDRSKALRCLLDFAAVDGDWDEIFGQVRCIRCGAPGWTESLNPNIAKKP